MKSRLVLCIFLVFAEITLFGQNTWPLKNTGGIQFTSSSYGLRKNPMGGASSGFHMGIDIACRVGTPILAVNDGTILVCAFDDPVYGKYMILRIKDGTDCLYAHLSQTWISKGTIVKKGQVLGLSGNTGLSTGPHLHFGLMKDPILFFDDSKNKNDLTGGSIAP